MLQFNLTNCQILCLYILFFSKNIIRAKESYKFWSETTSAFSIPAYVHALIDSFE